MIGWLPTAPRSVEFGTPQPSYQLDTFGGIVRPEPMPAHHKKRAMAAVGHATRLYPGPVGDVLADALRSYAEFGWAARADTPIARLVDLLMTEPLPGASG